MLQWEGPQGEAAVLLGSAFPLHRPTSSPVVQPRFRAAPPIKQSHASALGLNVILAIIVSIRQMKSEV